MFFLLFAFALVSLPALTAGARETGKCAPVTWSNAKPGEEQEEAPQYVRRWESVITTGYIDPGEVNCRSGAPSRIQVDQDTCAYMANFFGIEIEKFFMLNPTLSKDCSNIQPDTMYCVDGFIEPLRAYDGRCGPPHNNASCLGMDSGECCNSETWTCGDTIEDCARGTCFDGICFGDKIFSTDGTCGPQHGNRLCAGKQGICCHVNGTCGSGEAFCGTDVCLLGNCTGPEGVTVPTHPVWLEGNTTDRSCGGPNKYTCNLLYGWCCNKNNQCGWKDSDCGEGCQPEWGNCY